MNVAKWFAVNLDRKINIVLSILFHYRISISQCTFNYILTEELRIKF